MKKAVSAGGILIKFEQNIPKICLVKLTPPKSGFVFPKGHVKKHETIQEAAIREVREETGISNIDIKDYLGFLTRTSTENDGTEVKKDIHLYLMRTSQVDHANADEEYEWVTLEKAANILTFDVEKRFLVKNKKLIVSKV